ncbi:MAG TPA: hypothetical protein VMG34_12140 [Bacteroidota bacterium]|nr:hypothetical protein [Bacteroidota bacterium]
MTLEEKKIYHQIHPVQLGVDFVTGFGAVFMLWQQSLWGIAVAFVPSTLVSLYIIAKVDLERYKASSFGLYARKHLASKSSDWMRFGGFAVMLMGGWLRLWWVIGAGFLGIVFIWCGGLLTPPKAKAEPPR